MKEDPELTEIRRTHMNRRTCDDCSNSESNIQLPWHHHTDKDDAWICSTCYARRILESQGMLVRISTEQIEVDYIHFLFHIHL